MIQFRNLLTGQVQSVTEGSRLHLLVEQSPKFEKVVARAGNSGRRSGSARKRADPDGGDASDGESGGSD